MQDTSTEKFSAVSTIVTLPLLLIPVVVTGFFFIYSLVGWVIEGDALARWQAEAMQVALLTAMGQVFVCLCIFAFARLRGLPWAHLLSWSGPVHIVIAVLLAILVYQRVA
ncbi:MAG: hypothetical protein AAF420_10320 [Pseudomonadota bacterium]